MMQKSKKNIIEVHRKNKIYNRMMDYLEDEGTAVKMYNQSLEDFIICHGIDSYFNKLHQQLDISMFCEIKKHQVLEDGVYILLDGSVTYTWVKNKNDRDLRTHLFTLAKIGMFTSLVQGAPDRDVHLANGYSIFINTPLSVIECQNGNISTCDQSCFLKLSPKVIEQTNFQYFKKERISAFNQAQLSSSKNQSADLWRMNYGLHHTFKTKTYVFRNRFHVENLGVLTKGTLLSHKSQSNKKMQLTGPTLLLLDYEYEVSSSNVQIIEVIKNPTILLNRFTQIKPILLNTTNKLFPSLHKDEKSQNRYIKGSVCQSFYEKQKNQDKKFKQHMKKRRQCNLFSKQSEQYWIIPHQLRKQNMPKVHKKQKNQSQRNKPLVLFRFPNRFRNSEKSTQFRQAPAKQLNNYLKQNLMVRLQSYSKQIFEDFRKSRFQKETVEKTSKLN